MEIAFFITILRNKRLLFVILEIYVSFVLQECYYCYIEKSNYKFSAWRLSK